MNESLVFELSVDTVNFVKGLATAKNGLEEFGNVGKASMAQLSTALKAVETQAKKTTDTEDLKKLQTEYGNLKTELSRLLSEFKKLKKISDETGDSFNETEPKIKKVPKGLSEVDDAARRSRIALYGVNQVVRDLPFGFIAISNNIPVVIDQFQALFADGKNVEKSFKALGQALVGAGGLSIAFSAGISVITSLIQEYGSLGAAINDIFDLIDKRVVAASRQKDAFASVQADTGGEVSGIQQLVNVIEDENRVRGEKVNAYLQLKKEYPGIIQNLTEEQALTKQGTDLIKFRSLQIIQYIQLKGREQALIKLVAEEEEKGLKATNKLLQQVTGEGQTWVDQLVDASRNAIFNNPIKSLKETSKEIVNAGKQTSVWSQTLKNVRDEILQLDPIITGLQKLEKIDVKLLDKKSLDELIASLIEQKSEVEKSRESFGLLTEDYLKASIAIAQIDAQIKKLKTTSVADKVKIDIELKDTIDKIKKDFEVGLKKAGQIEYTPIFKADTEEFKKRTLDLFNPEQVNKYAEALKNAGKVSGEFKIKLPEDLEKKGKELRAIIEDTTQLYETLAGVFSNLTSDFVDGIFDGKNAIDSLTNSLKKALVQLTALIAKTIVLESIKTALNVASGGTTGTASGIGKALLDLFSGGGVAAPRAGINVGQGGFALSGQVVFVQRGQDLVGVLSQSNARIGRVG